MKKLGMWIGVIFLFFSSGLAQTVAIRAGHVVDPAIGSVIDSQVILIRDGKIVEIGDKVATAGADRIIDLSNGWVMPGLMDAHVHLSLTIAPQQSLEMAYLNEGSAFRALRGLHTAGIVLRGGFTTVKDIGNDADYAVAEVRRAINEGWFPGPTILYAGKIIAPFGGQSHGVAPEHGAFWAFEYIDADTPEDIRKAVRRNIYYGATTIKLVADNSAYFYSEEEIRAAVSEAHRAGLTCTVHVMGGQAAKNVILGGADAIEHGFELSDELLMLMKEKGTVLVGTDFPVEQLKTMGALVGDADKMGAQIIDRLRRAHRIGVKMVFGTDTVMEIPGKTRADLMLDYIDVWQAAGVPAPKILRCMTTNAAELLGVQKERGALAPGLWADIIATSANPLENIQALRGITFVMKAGNVIRIPE